MVRPKPKSKRTPVRLRHKIEKASAAKQRKQRKLAKKNPEWRSRLKKDPGVPNLFPYKEKILQEIEEKRRLKEEETLRRREEGRSQEKGTSMQDTQREAPMEDLPQAEDSLEGEAEPVDDEMDEDDSADPMAALVMSARARAAEFEREHPAPMDDAAGDTSDDGDDDGDAAAASQPDGTAVPVAPLRRDLSRRAFDRVFKQVLEAADVILYVLDARDPEGTRSREVERMVMAADAGQKRLLLILNKIDLIPPAVLKGWLVHLRRSFPTVPLRAAGPATSAHTFHHRQLTPQTTAVTLFNALKSFAAAKQLKGSISVGVVGYPNVGKSSVINALMSRLGGGASACPVGAEAGVTTSLRRVKLDRKLTLLDSPGIVFPGTAQGSGTDEQARLILLNAVPPKQIDDPIPAVSLLLRRFSSAPDAFQALLDAYSLPPLMVAGSKGDMTTDFLVQVARRRGRLGKGGVPNLHSAATTVLTDWRDGRIRGWMDPPDPPTAPADAKMDNATGVVVGRDHKAIVSEWAEEFKLDGLWGDAEHETDGPEATT